MKWTLKLRVLVLAYVVGFLCTYGYAYRETVIGNRIQYVHLNPYDMAEMDALLKTAIWPLYLPTHLSYKLWNTSL